MSVKLISTEGNFRPASKLQVVPAIFLKVNAAVALTHIGKDKLGSFALRMALTQCTVTILAYFWTLKMSTRSVFCHFESDVSQKISRKIILQESI